MTPAISLFIGVLIKFILNITLVKIEKIGAVGAAFATAMCHIVAFIIAFSVLKKHTKIKFRITTFLVKPVIATAAMSVCSYAVYIFIASIAKEKLAILISIIIAILIYILSIICLKIFAKEEILSIPFGNKIYKILKFLKIY